MAIVEPVHICAHTCVHVSGYVSGHIRLCLLDSFLSRHVSSSLHSSVMIIPDMGKDGSGIHPSKDILVNHFPSLPLKTMINKVVVRAGELAQL